MLRPVSKGRLQTAVVERDDTLCIRRTLHEHTYEANADRDMVLISVLEVPEGHRSVPFPKEDPYNEPGTVALRDSASLHLPWISRMVLSQSEM